MSRSCTLNLFDLHGSHQNIPLHEQDALGATLEYRLDRTAIAPVALDVPHMVSLIDGFLQLRQYEAFQNYAASKTFLASFFLPRMLTGHLKCRRNPAFVDRDRL